MKRFIKIFFWGLLLFSITSCIKQESFTESIYVDEVELDPGAVTYPFDKWLHDNYLIPYNIDFRYTLQGVNSDISYNLVPTSIDNSVNVAILIKYLWFDAYATVVSEDFLKQYGPRIIQLIGSAAYNPSLGTKILGTAEGGIQVTIYQCNQMATDPIDIDSLNEYCFKTMHHEFGHILQQHKTYPAVFDSYSAGQYDPTGWQNRTAVQAAVLGFVSPYAGMEPGEDWVEVIANYIVKSDAQWKNILNMAASQRGPLPMRGDSIIMTKLDLCRKWLDEAWKIDVDALHKEVTNRQNYIGDALTQGRIDIYGTN